MMNSMDDMKDFESMYGKVYFLIKDYELAGTIFPKSFLSGTTWQVVSLMSDSENPENKAYLMEQKSNFFNRIEFSGREFKEYFATIQELRDFKLDQILN